MEGKTLAGRYRVVRHLGGGGFSQTYIAQDLHLPNQPQCVIKHLKPASSQREVLSFARQLFDREAKALYRLGRHECIPSLLAHFEEDEEFFLAQEFIEGQTLAREIRKGQCYGEAYVVNLLHDVLSTLDFVHRQQVIHRDLKPANLIRRNADRRLVLIDFGAVKDVGAPPSAPDAGTSSDSYASMVVGSVGYMPNEQLSGQACFASDIYALGMIAVQALTGKSPRQIPIDPRTSELQWHDLVNISPALRDLLSRMMLYDYRQRFANAAEAWQFVRHLHEQSSGVTVVLQAPTEDTQFSQGQASLWQQVVAEFDLIGDPIRAKKLMGLVSTGVLENDPYRLNMLGFRDLVQNLRSQNATSSQLKNNLVNAVKTINPGKQKQYLEIAKTIYRNFLPLYEQGSGPELTSLHTSVMYSEPLIPKPNTPSIYEPVFAAIAADPQQLRLRKLLLYACRDLWESDPEVLDNVDWEGVTRELVETCPTLESLRAWLDEVVTNLSKPIEYGAIADLLVEKFMPLYDQMILPMEQGSSNLFGDELPIKLPPEFLGDLSDPRFELMNAANPFRVKLLLSSFLNLSSNPEDAANWPELRRVELVVLLRQVFFACVSLDELDNKLQQIARLFSQPETYLQVASQVVRALRPLYQQLSEMGIKHPAQSDVSDSTQLYQEFYPSGM
ncbi:MAG: serine/threonine protein kinase [Oscillatoriales cyanobacterium SM2_2_1]|nr:serine/threonine protein kinase [Oscillatoriales cyanobacterium SM2_2_1]